MQILFVPLTENDLELILPLYNHYIRETTATLDEDEWTATDLHRRMLPDSSRFGTWKISVDGRPVGFVSLGPYQPGRAWETTAEVTIYLDPAWPGKGVGTQALAYAEYRAKERGFHILFASICAENAGSIRLFERQGYRECSRIKEAARKFGRWLDVVGLEKRL
jgi:phosphinothricin acetyltransferase